MLDNIDAAARNFAGELDIVNLLALSHEEALQRLMRADVIYVLGGHADYLMHVFQKSGLAKSLTHLLERKVYVGSSAGSMILGRRLPGEVYEQIYGEESGYGIKSYLNLVVFSIMPHLDSSEYPHTNETLREALNDYRGKVYGLRDDGAVIVHGQKIRLVGR